MEDPTKFKQEVLDILKQLKDICERAEEHYIEKVKNDKFLEIFASDLKLDFFFGNMDHLDDVAQYLQNRGLNLVITADFDDPEPESFWKN